MQLIRFGQVLGNVTPNNSNKQYLQKKRIEKAEPEPAQPQPPSNPTPN